MRVRGIIVKYLSLGVNVFDPRSAAATLGGLTGWSEDQMSKLKEEAVAAFGAVNTWSAAQLGDAGAAIGTSELRPRQSLRKFTRYLQFLQPE